MAWLHWQALTAAVATEDPMASANIGVMYECAGGASWVRRVVHGAGDRCSSLLRNPFDSFLILIRLGSRAE
ncbi:hypothetical protein BRAO375_1000002 [Bradyrhizobium sp. ORS 375]|nr:hypothetical protein BRAO375_1000002 [Bradyrhizobium sp. ORS 375]